MKKLSQHILDLGLKDIAIIGLAKNAGKTVSFNTIVLESAENGVKMALLSYGRDGEEVDAITRKEKPRIYIPPNCIFVTASKACEKSGLKARLLKRTGINTLLGEVNIYQTENTGGYVELVGINSASGLQEIKDLITDEVDLVLIDGALDRRSSARPMLTEGLILATGAVIGNTEELVVRRTLNELGKLTLPRVEAPELSLLARRLLQDGQGGLVEEDGQVQRLFSRTTLGSLQEIEEKLNPTSKTLILGGAVVDSFIEQLIFKLKVKDLMILVRDGTRVFLNNRNLNLLENYNIDLKVLDSMEPVGVTVNPTSPYGVHLNSTVLVEMLREKLPQVPVFDVLNKEYLTLKG